jgi:hypothetical protein
MTRGMDERALRGMLEQSSVDTWEPIAARMPREGLSGTVVGSVAEQARQALVAPIRELAESRGIRRSTGNDRAIVGGFAKALGAAWAVGLPAAALTGPISREIGNLFLKRLLRPLTETDSKLSSGLSPSRPTTHNTIALAGLRLVPFEYTTYYEISIYGLDGFWLMDASDIYWALHSRYPMGPADLLFVGYSDCEQASETYIASLDVVNQALADSAEYANAINEVAAYNCELPNGWTGSGITCLDFFIAAKTAGPLNGDNRGFDSSAPIDKSRVQVYVDFENNRAKVLVNGSSSWVPLVSPTPGFEHSPQHFEVDTISESQRKVKFKFYNGYCDGAMHVLCPAIDGEVTFTRGGNGTWVPSAPVRDGFPSLGVYRSQANGSFSTQLLSPEQTGIGPFPIGGWIHLASVSALIDSLKKKLLTLPPGCHLE